MDKSVRKYLVVMLFVVLFLSFTVPGSNVFAGAPGSCYILTTAVSPAASGTVNVTEATNCVNGTTPGYTSGTVVTVTAVPASVNIFSNWTFAVPANANPATVTMTSNKTVTAFFRKQIVLNEPSGTKNIYQWDNKYTFTPTTGSISYVIDVQKEIASVYSTVYTKTFQPASFCTSSTCTYFIADENQMPPLGDGTYRWRVSSIYAGFATWTDYKAFILNRGTVLPTAPTGRIDTWDYTLRWNGVTGANWYRVTFQKAGATLTPIISNRAIQAGTICTGTAPILCVYTLPLADRTTIRTGLDYDWEVRAQTPVSNTFLPWAPWKGFNLRTPPPCYTLSTSVNNVAFGTIVINTPANCGSQYVSGTVVSLTATPESNAIFSYWTGAASGYTNPVSITMTADKSVSALFRQKSILISPNGPLTSWDNSFAWTGVIGADYYNTWYHLIVQNAAGTTTYLSQEYLSPYILSNSLVPNCDISNNCRVVPVNWIILPNGAYRWQLHDHSLNTGDGPFTDWMYFTLNR